MTYTVAEWLELTARLTAAGYPDATLHDPTEDYERRITIPREDGNRIVVLESLFVPGLRVYLEDSGGYVIEVTRRDLESAPEVIDAVNQASQQ